MKTFQDSVEEFIITCNSVKEDPKAEKLLHICTRISNVIESAKFQLQTSDLYKIADLLKQGWKSYYSYKGTFN